MHHLGLVITTLPQRTVIVRQPLLRLLRGGSRRPTQLAQLLPYLHRVPLMMLMRMMHMVLVMIVMVMVMSIRIVAGLGRMDWSLSAPGEGTPAVILRGAVG